MYKFLFYKMYRYSKTQEEAVGTDFAFMLFMTIFQLLNLLVLGLFFKIFGVNIKINAIFFPILFLVIGFGLNYIIFIQTKLIYKINEHYQAKNLKAWKGNLLFFGYIILLFVIMFIQTWYYQKYK